MKSTVRSLINSFFWFGIVGLTAMTVHFLTVTKIFIPLLLPPFIANTGGFLLAFLVSFSGHYKLTFKEQTLKATKSWQKFLYKFFIVAIIGFGINQIIFNFLLNFTLWHLELCLVITLFSVAVITYIISKQWAFKS